MNFFPQRGRGKIWKADFAVLVDAHDILRRGPAVAVALQVPLHYLSSVLTFAD